MPDFLGPSWVLITALAHPVMKGLEELSESIERYLHTPLVVGGGNDNKSKTLFLALKIPFPLPVIAVDWSCVPGSGGDNAAARKGFPAGSQHRGG